MQFRIELLDFSVCCTPILCAVVLWKNCFGVLSFVTIEMFKGSFRGTMKYYAVTQR
jgi:hypothetical protein